MSSSSSDEPLKPRFDISEQEALQRLSHQRAIPARRGARKFSSGLHKVTRAILKDEGPGIDQLIARWKDLVGERLAKVSVPTKLTKSKDGSILHLDIAPAAAPLFQHQGEALRKKISILIGGNLKAIKLHQKTVTSSSGDGEKRRHILTIEETKEIESAVTDVKNYELRKALMNFGKSVVQNSQK